METFKHKLPLQIRFNDIDMMGHVNNAVLMEFFDYGKMKYFDAVGVDVEKENSTIVIVHYEVDFRGQVTLHSNAEVCTKVIRFGEKSLQILQHIVCDGEVKAVCRTVMSGYNRTTRTSETISEKIKNELRKYEEN